MTVLETVIEMQRNGMSDNEISQTLQSQGISPRDINDSINQAKIKNAINQESGSQTEIAQPLETREFPSPEKNNETRIQRPELQMPQPSITEIGDSENTLGGELNQQINENNYPEQFQNQYVQQYPEMGYPEQSEDPYYQEGYGQDYYDDYYNQSQGYLGTETITEIAEQVVDEKFNEYNKKTGDVVSFKTIIQEKVTNIEERLKRIENTIDKLQHAVIQKIGEFGETNSFIRKDLENLHNTTSKLMNPLIDNYRELEKLNQKKR